MIVLFLIDQNRSLLQSVQVWAFRPFADQNLTGFKDILDHIKTIKPKMTIFEIKEKKTKNSDLSNAANVMRQLKSKNSHIIEKFKGILINI